MSSPGFNAPSTSDPGARAAASEADETDKKHVHVLLIEDDEDDFFITRSLLSKATMVEASVEWVRAYDEGLAAVLSGRYDICLVDYRLGPEDGLDLLRTALDRGCRTPIILVTGRGDHAVDAEAMKAGAADYLIKGELTAPMLDRSIRYAQQRRRSEDRIREQARLLNEAHDSICAYDVDFNITYWNQGAERMTGWTADDMMKGTGDCETADQCLYGADNETLAEARATVLEEGEWTGEVRQHTKEGGEIVVESRWTLVRDADGEPEAILVINTDITERKKLESQFLRSQRMESIGRLVGGIAHDLGNLLVPVLLGSEVLQQRHGENERDRRTLDMIQKSAQRGSDMVKQVLAFARGVEGEHVAVHLSTILEEVERITEETFPDDIEMETTFEDGLWTVEGDATQLQQVVMNLCVNARDAMEDGGRLTIRAGNATLDEGDVPPALEAEPGSYVCITVADTGTGIPADELGKVFEPFFTTKPAGKGTGLGLSTAYSIMKSHGGFIDVDSAQAEGTTFRVYIPEAEEGLEEDAPALTAEQRDGHGARLLVVDDEVSILETSKDTLRGAGFDVVTAQDGAAALRLLGEHAIDAVITDIAMPEMNGLDVIRTIRGRQPDVAIIAMSGLSDSETDEALEAGADYFLSKPFDMKKLHAALDTVLGRRRQTV